MAQEFINFKTPVGRMVMGSLSTPQTKDADGKPLVIKQGPDIGKPTQKYFFAMAIDKTPGFTHWSQEAWGKDIWALGHAAFPGIAQTPTFSWKIDDGDSSLPNRKGKKLSDNPNLRGKWVLFFSQPSPTKCYNYRVSGGAEIDAKQINCGDYIQVMVYAKGNNSSQNPGVYLNPQMCDLVGYGERIVMGADPTAAGFGIDALPPGASATPVSSMPMSGMAPPPPVPMAAAQVLPPAYNPAPAVPAPNVAILTPPPASVAPAGPQMTAKAGGQPLSAFLAAGWTLESLKAQGYIS